MERGSWEHILNLSAKKINVYLNKKFSGMPAEIAIFKMSDRDLTTASKVKVPQQTAKWFSADTLWLMIRSHTIKEEGYSALEHYDNHGYSPGTRICGDFVYVLTEKTVDELKTKMAVKIVKNLKIKSAKAFKSFLKSLTEEPYNFASANLQDIAKKMKEAIVSNYKNALDDRIKV